MFPLAICLAYFAAAFAILPCFHFTKSGWRNLGKPPGDPDRSSDSSDSDDEDNNRGTGTNGRRWLPPVLDKNGKPAKGAGGVGTSGKETEKDGDNEEAPKVDRPPSYDDLAAAASKDRDPDENRSLPAGDDDDGSEVKEVHKSKHAASGSRSSI